MREDQYWVPIEGEWYPVPSEAVIKTKNPVGEAIVWYLHKEPEADLSGDEQYKIICFVPSAGIWSARFRQLSDIRRDPSRAHSSALG
jgi:hypothetical protein